MLCFSESTDGLMLKPERMDHIMSEEVLQHEIPGCHNGAAKEISPLEGAGEHDEAAMTSLQDSAMLSVAASMHVRNMAGEAVRQVSCEPAPPPADNPIPQQLHVIMPHTDDTPVQQQMSPDVLAEPSSERHLVSSFCTDQSKHSIEAGN